MSDELKPCPFCGNDDLQIGSYLGALNDTAYDVQCVCSVKFTGGDSEEEIRNKWNRRVDSGIGAEEREMDALRPCPFCGGRPVIVPERWPEVDFTYYRVVCRDCLIGTTQHCSESAAKSRWNRRDEILPVESVPWSGAYYPMLDLPEKSNEDERPEEEK